MCDLICDVISCSVEAATWVKSIYMKNHNCTPEKREIWKSKKLLHKSSNWWFMNGIHSLLSRAEARGSADIIYRM